MSTRIKVRKLTMNNLIFFIIFISMWILFGWNYNNADYYNYENVYNYIGYHGWYLGIESGYALACKIGNLIGLSYNNFLVIYSFIGLYLIANSIKKYTKKYNSVFILYLIYPFLLDIVQIRNFMAMAIIIYSVRYLFNYKKNDTFKYIILVLIASSFHSSAIFYFLFILVFVKSNKKLMIFTIISTSALFFIKGFLSTIASKVFPNKSYDIYFNSSTSTYAKVAFIIYLIANLILVYYSYKSVKKNLYNISEVNFAEIIMKINIVMLMIYVFLWIDVDFIRLYRNILPLNYALFFMIKIDGKLVRKKDKILYELIVVGFVLLSSYAFIYWQNYESVVQPIFNENTILNIFR